MSKKAKALSSAKRCDSVLSAARIEIAGARGAAFAMYAEPLVTPTSIYHFSTLAGTQSILKSGVLRAKDLRGMEDTEEIRYACDVLTKVASRTHYIKAVGENLAKDFLDTCIHVACLTMESLLRTQWCKYADKARGCAIGFHFQSITPSAKPNLFSFPLAYDPVVQEQMFEHVLKEAERLQRTLKGTSRKTFQDDVIRVIAALLSAVKKPTFAAEHEWRLQVDHDDPDFERVVLDDGVCRRAIPICRPDTISELVLGPVCPMGVDEATELLKGHGYVNANVRRISWTDLV